MQVGGLGGRSRGPRRDWITDVKRSGRRRVPQNASGGCRRSQRMERGVVCAQGVPRVWCYGTDLTCYNYILVNFWTHFWTSVVNKSSKILLYFPTIQNIVWSKIENGLESSTAVHSQQRSIIHNYWFSLPFQSSSNEMCYLSIRCSTLNYFWSYLHPDLAGFLAFFARIETLEWTGDSTLYY